MRLRSSLAVLLAAALVLPPCGMGQQPAGAAAPAPAAGGLKIVAVEGEGAVNNVRRKVGVTPVVEVRDAGDKPVAGAEVIFSLPASGPGGNFHGWMRTQTTKTNEQGRAGTAGFTPNDEVGRFNIKVTATSGANKGSLVISQVNSAAGGAGTEIGSKSNLKWKIIGVLAAGAAIGSVAAVKRGNNGTTAAVATPITITPGPVTVAAPR